ncbi:MAG: hypothetical protein LBU21_04075 [Treponema sp.]|nr:hypothetical protein [Treponema sp.]
MIKICGLSLWLLVLAAAPGFTVSPEELIGAGLMAEVLREGVVTRVQQREIRPELAPRHDFTRALVDETIQRLDANILVESLSLYRKSAGTSAGGAGTEAHAWSETERRALYNQALALSSLTGIQYFSTSRNRMRTFYEISTVIDGPDTGNPLEDPVYALPPAELVLYARQKDLTFGENIYRYTYYARPEALIFVQENITAMNVGIIPAVGKNRLRSAVAVIDAGPYLIIYAVSMARAASVPGMNRRVGASFSTRAEAILKWFAGRADRAFGR